MRLIYSLIPFFYSMTAFAADGNRSIFQDENGNGVDNATLRSGNIHMDQVPSIIIAITNNLLKFVGYVSLAIILIGALLYVFGGVNEEWKSKGKEAIKMALFGAIVSWSGWLLINFIIDNT